jgi:hypothetical protein
VWCARASQFTGPDRGNRPNTRLGVASSDYLSAVEIVENVALRRVPRPVIIGMTATAIPEAIRPYSIAVAALSSLKNLMIRRNGNSL